MTISLDLGLNAGSKKPPKPVTITNAAAVSKLRALIDSLPLYPPGVLSCPMDDGAALALTFRARPGAQALAVAIDTLSGCAAVDFTLAGKPQPTLAYTSDAQLLKIAGLNWKIPGL